MVEDHEVVPVDRIADHLPELVRLAPRSALPRRNHDQQGEELRRFGDFELPDDRREDVGLRPIVGDEQNREPRVANPQERRLHHEPDGALQVRDGLLDPIADRLPQQTAGERLRNGREPLSTHRRARPG